MADFGLSNLRDGVQKRADELSGDARARSFDDRGREDDGPFKPFTFQQEDFDRTEPDHDAMRKYWRQFETTPFVRKSITSFSRQVMEPGYYIRARDVDQETLRDIDNWLTKSAIIEGELGQDFRQLAKKAIVQQEVRGTAFIEKAPSKNDSDELAGLKLINAETMEAVTRPGQSILLQPDDIDEYEGAPEAESGGAAAWLQDLGETQTFFNTPVRGRDRGLDDDEDTDRDFKIGFRDDEIIKLARDADAGELFGTSRLEAVSDRIEGLRNKLSDNDDAIASKAYPLWLFLFGSEENPWDSDDIDSFMSAHEMENFHSGMKQGVRGDVSVETVSGEVAEIAESLNFDIEWIMSIMPIPKFALGAFADTGVGQFGGIAQQQETQRQIKDTRREIEEKFTPVIQQVAEQFGLSEDEAETIRLKIGSPGEPETEVPRRENIIRYVPEGQRDGGGNTQDSSDDETPMEQPETPEQPGAEPASEPAESAGAQSWHIDQGMAQLSLSSDSELSDIIYDAMVETRDTTLDKVEREFENAPTFAAAKFEQQANSVMQRQFARGQFRRKITPIVEELVEGDQSFRRSNNVKFFAQDIQNATEDAIEEMLRLMRIQVRRGANEGSEFDDIMQRTRNRYNDAKLRERSELIAYMESKNITESVKLQEFEANDDVIGVRVVNENPSTPLTKSLNGVEAYFDDGTIQEQLQSATRSEFMQKGFDPLPATPPFHFNDTSSLEPIYSEDADS